MQIINITDSHGRVIDFEVVKETPQRDLIRESLKNDEVCELSPEEVCKRARFFLYEIKNGEYNK